MNTPRTLHSVFWEHVKHHPDDVALCMQNTGTPDIKLTYEDLGQHVFACMKVLQNCGVVHKDHVAFLYEKSIDSVVVLLAILSLGSAYIPLDVKTPAPRLASIVQNSQPRVVVYSQQQHELSKNIQQALDVNTSINFSAFSSPTDVFAKTTRELFLQKILSYQKQDITTPDDLAYILYTSGSTGIPKGVMLSHQNGASFVDWAIETYQLQKIDRFASVAPFHFDLSILDLFACLTVGATLILLPPQLLLFPPQLARWIEKNQITVWYSVPSILTAMMQHTDLSKRNLSSLRVVFFAGEVFPTPHLRRWLQLLPHAQFGNLYGPTETNVCTYYNPTLSTVQTEFIDDRNIPIGQAIFETTLFLVVTPTDPNTSTDISIVASPFLPEHTGLEGELYVAGPTVMRGYLNDAEKTRASLWGLSSLAPHIQKPCYKTGDLVRVLSDGNLAFLGRADHQIKTRGFRVELGEIETALCKHASIQEAVVVPVADASFGNILYAFVVVSHNGQSDTTSISHAPHAPSNDAVMDTVMDAVTGYAPTESALRAFVASLLPSYMVPEKIFIETHLPRTSTDKVDRRALAALAATRRESL